MITCTAFDYVEVTKDLEELMKKQDGHFEIPMRDKEEKDLSEFRMDLPRAISNTSILLEDKESTAALYPF